MVDEVLFSSKNSDWETPKDLFNYLNWIFQFTLDPCAIKKNAKCKKYYSRRQNGLIRSWAGEKVFMNPPYGTEIKHWIEKAFRESLQNKITVICLVPARTDTKWWHRFIMKSTSIWFIEGRLQFVGSKYKAPFPSAIVRFDGRLHHKPVISRMYKYKNIRWAVDP